MICVACRNAAHSGCPGGTWCDCQHVEREDQEQGNGAGVATVPAPPGGG